MTGLLLHLPDGRVKSTSAVPRLHLGLAADVALDHAATALQDSTPAGQRVVWLAVAHHLGLPDTEDGRNRWAALVETVRELDAHDGWCQGACAEGAAPGSSLTTVCQATTDGLLAERDDALHALLAGAS